MIKVICNRLYKGGVDIRSHIVEKAIEKDQFIAVNLAETGDTIAYSPKELKNPMSISKEYKSKFGRNYKLHFYKWKK